jgi:predicted molibdopterin-dependent oxidoreductase YjgC
MSCKDCLVKKKCELQKIAKVLGVRLKAKHGLQSKCDIAGKLEHPSLDLLPSKCILCRKCLIVCGEKNAQPVLTFIKNGNGVDPVIGFTGEREGPLPCDTCGACIEICPVNAIVPKSKEPKEASAAE